MLIPHFIYHRPSSLKEACEMKAELGDKAVILAGGTDVIVNIKKGIISPENLISLRDLEELRSITFTKENKKTKIGACVTASDVIRNETIKKHFNALATGADSLGSPIIRNLATLGGNLVTARPAADLSPSFMSFDAKISLISVKGKREIPVNEMFLGPGKTVLEKDELLEEIVIDSPPPHSGCAYQKLGVRRALEIGLVNVAVFLTLEKPEGPIKEARIVLGSVAPVPMRAMRAERCLTGEQPGQDLFDKAAKAASEESRSIDDFRGSAEYRREMVRNLTKRNLVLAFNEAANH
jgi:carbon-monoxide dehydrogenase medium subunit